MHALCVCVCLCFVQRKRLLTCCHLLVSEFLRWRMIVGLEHQGTQKRRTEPRCNHVNMQDVACSSVPALGILDHTLRKLAAIYFHIPHAGTPSPTQQGSHPRSWSGFPMKRRFIHACLPDAVRIVIMNWIEDRLVGSRIVGSTSNIRSDSTGETIF